MIPVHKNSGFVLITFLIQLPIIIFIFYWITQLTLISEFKNKILEICFLDSLKMIQSADSCPIKNSHLDYLMTQEHFENSKISMNVQDLNTRSEFIKLDTNKVDIKVVTNLNILINIKQINNFKHVTNINCGAQKICQNQKCQYGIIVDKF